MEPKPAACPEEAEKDLGGARESACGQARRAFAGVKLEVDCIGDAVAEDPAVHLSDEVRVVATAVAVRSQSNGTSFPFLASYLATTQFPTPGMSL